MNETPTSQDSPTESVAPEQSSVVIAKSAGSSPTRSASPSVVVVVPMLVNEIDFSVEVSPTFTSGYSSDSASWSRATMSRAEP